MGTLLVPSSRFAGAALSGGHLVRRRRRAQGSSTPLRPGSTRMTITANPSVRQVLAQVVRDPDYAAIAHKPTWQVPHLALTAGSWALFVGSTWAYLAGNLPLLAMILLNQFAFYATFTPLHDAVHNA